MFTHNFKYAFKTLLKNESLIFWTFAFPIILGTFFYMAFSNIESSEELDVINIALVDSENYDGILKLALDEMSIDKNDEGLFDIQYGDLESAEDLLESGDIVGYVLLKDEPKIVIKSNGIDETVLKYVVEEILETEAIIEDYVDEGIKNGTIDYADLETEINDIYQIIEKIENSAREMIKDESKANLSYTMIEYYTLIAMACLYGGVLSMYAMNQVLANMSSKGKRISVSPASKMTIVLSSALASYIVQIMGLILLFSIRVSFSEWIMEIKAYQS